MKYSIALACTMASSLGTSTIDGAILFNGKTTYDYVLSNKKLPAESQKNCAEKNVDPKTRAVEDTIINTEEEKACQAKKDAARDLSGVILSGKDLTKYVLAGANLRDAKLIGTTLIETNLRNADLSNANLSNATLTGAVLTKTHLNGATLTGAKQNKTLVTKEWLKQKGAIFDDTTKF